MATIDLDTLLELVGDLNDSSEPGSASDRFRKYLHANLTAAADVRAYVERSLQQSGDQYNKALQDLINHLGQLLGFEVTYGRYRGVRNDIGFDGLWQSPTKGWSIVVETKTTDTYTVRTATLLGYINGLVSESRISRDKALGLYVQGRPDAATNQLENAIIVEGRDKQLRLIGVPSLISLLELKQDYNLSHDTVLDLLLPSPIRIDPLVELIRNVVSLEQERDEVEEDEVISVLAKGEDSTAPKAKRTQRPRQGSYTGTKPTAVILDGQRVEVSTWREALEAVIGFLVQTDKQRFERVAPTLVGKKRPYFTSDPDLLRMPGAIPGTNLYFETNLGAASITRIADELVNRTGAGSDTLSFETR